MFIYVALDALMLVVLVAIGYSERETERLPSIEISAGHSDNT